MAWTNNIVLGSIAKGLEGELEGGFHRTNDSFRTSYNYKTVTLNTTNYFGFEGYEFEAYVDTFSDVTVIEIAATEQPLIKTLLCEGEDNTSIEEIESS